MVDIRRLPINDKTNGWNVILPQRTPNPALAGEIKADWVVAGAGYAGLAAARRLAANRPGDKIVVLDAGAMGENASARNSGFAIDLPHAVGGGHDDLDGAHRYMALARAAIADLAENVEAHNIQCNWSARGKYHTAVTARGEEEYIAPFVAALDRLGEPYRRLDAAQIAAELGTPYYHCAIYTPGCVLMNPAALSRGLADNLPAGVRLYENTPITRFVQDNGICLTTPGGSVRAPRMILATNAFAQKFGFFKGRLLPFHAHASLTRQLDAEEQKALGGVGDWGVTPANAFVSVTMRYTQDHRILIRQDFGYCPDQRVSAEAQVRARAGHERIFHERFPTLPKVTMEHTWTGFVCLSANHAPGFGQVAPNVWTAVCQNAVGVTKGTISGLLAADLACGIDNPLIADMQSLGTPSRLPPRPLLDIGVAVRNGYDMWRSRHEA